MKLETGKLDSDMLRQIVFGKITYRNDDVKVRPGIGEDCALIDFGDYDCVMSTDPISSTVSDIGRLAIHITCNDIASNGVQPLRIMLAVMLPEGTTDDVRHTRTNGHPPETVAVLKSTTNDSRHTVGDDDGLQCLAALKSPLADARQALRKSDAPK